MKKLFLFSFILTLTFSSCKKEATATVEENSVSAAFDQLLQDFNEESYELYPINATYAGDNRFNDKLPNNLTDEFAAKEKAYYTKYKNALGNFDDADLTASEKMSKNVLAWDCDINLERLTFNKDLMPIDQMWTRNLDISQFAEGNNAQPFVTVQDYENWLKRVDSYIEWLNSAEEKMRQGMKEGYVLPKSLIVKVIPQFESLTTGKVVDHLFFTPANNIPEEISFVDRKNIMDAYMAMVQDKIIPANKKMLAFLKDEYLAAGRDTSGYSDLPNGEAYYNHQIKTYTTTTMTADEIHQIGLSEVARILSEMEEVKKQVGFEGDIISFFEHIRVRKELMPYTEAQQMVDHFNDVHETMKPQLAILFDKTPKTPFEVRKTEAFREKSAAANYNPGSVDGTRPGIFFSPIPDPKIYNTYKDEALFLHEAIPGHHYQISLTQENEDLPDFRKTLWYSAYGEGWALYTESLGKELGLYTDPYQYFGMLSAEMHRAIRLVVDTGIHTKGWTREQAMQYSLENEAEQPYKVEREIERYMANPGQSLSYKIGQLKILELRARAEAALGDKFDIKEYHNQVLETGCIPLQLLENKIDAWIEASK